MEEKYRPIHRSRGNLENILKRKAPEIFSFSQDDINKSISSPSPLAYTVFFLNPTTYPKPHFPLTDKIKEIIASKSQSSHMTAKTPDPASPSK